MPVKPDPFALIVPGRSAGGIELGAPVLEYLEPIFESWRKTFKDSCELVNPMEARYRLAGGIAIGVDVVTGRIFKIIAQAGYQGWLEAGITKIRVGDCCSELKKQVPSLCFDEAQSLFLLPESPGVCLEVADIDPSESQAWKMTVESITVTDLQLLSQSNDRLRRR